MDVSISFGVSVGESVEVSVSVSGSVGDKQKGQDDKRCLRSEMRFFQA